MVYLPLILKRIFSALITLLIVSALIYGFLEMLPGDVATRMLGRTATPETLANLREQLGLNEPALKRYFLWLYNIFQGDFGTALTSKRPISEILAPKIFNTLILSGCAFILYLPLSFITALLQAYYKNKNIDISCGGVLGVVRMVYGFSNAINYFSLSNVSLCCEDVKR